MCPEMGQNIRNFSGSIKSCYEFCEFQIYFQVKFGLLSYALHSPININIIISNVTISEMHFTFNYKLNILRDLYKPLS